MDSLKDDVIRKGLPWSRDVAWPVVAVEAVILVGIGAFMLLDKDTASDVILQLIGVVLLVLSLVLGLAGWRNAESGLGFFDAFRAGVGATAGAIATASWFSEYIQDSAVRLILGWGLVVYSLFHLVGQVAVRGRGGLRLGVIITVVITLVLGIVLLTSNSDRATDRITFLGVTLLVFGALLGALAWYLYTRSRAGAVATA